jgi:hypothetical protein
VRSALMFKQPTPFTFILLSARNPNAIRWCTLRLRVLLSGHHTLRGGQTYLLLAASADRAHSNTRHRGRIPGTSNKGQDSNGASPAYSRCIIGYTVGNFLSVLGLGRGEMTDGLQVQTLFNLTNREMYRFLR